MTRASRDGVISLLVVLLVGGAFWWWTTRPEPPGTAGPTPTTTSSTPPRPSKTPTSAATNTPTRTGTPDLPAGEWTVSWVTDGDTITVGDAETPRRGSVRILGLDAPEVAHGATPAQCHGPEAKEALRALVMGATVRLVDDSRAPDHDRFGRRLAYVEVKGKDVAELMIRAGHALEMHLPSAGPGDRTPVYEAAERAARKAAVGLWAHCPAP